MPLEHRARIMWSPELLQLGLPAISEITDPSWFDGTDPRNGESWSLVCRFDLPANQQGNPTYARVRFLMDAAPHERLKPGVVLQLFERATKGHARVEILGSHSDAT